MVPEGVTQEDERARPLLKEPYPPLNCRNQGPKRGKTIIMQLSHIMQLTRAGPGL